MALDFPSPAGQTPANTFSPTSTPSATTNGLTYVYDSEKWLLNGTDVFVEIAGDTMTGDLTVPNLISEGDIQSTSQNGGPLAGFRNLFINGDFNVFQRPIEGISKAGTGYAMDRWVIGAGSTPQRTNQTVGYFQNVIQISGGATAGYLRQAIELAVPGKLGVFGGGSTSYTISIYAKAQPQIEVFFADENIALGNRVDWLTLTSMTATGESTSGSPTGTLNRYSVTIDSAPTPSSANTCLIVAFRGAEYYTAAQFEPGPVATRFEQRPIGTELALCQRYYEELDLFTSSFATTTSIANTYGFTVEKRVVPTATRIADSTRSAAAGYAVVSPGKTNVYVGFTLPSTSGYAAGGIYALDAEL